MLPVIAVVCDDTRTALVYFGLLQRLHKWYVTLKVVRAPCKGASPSIVVKKAIYVLEELKKHSGEESDVTIVWAVLDLEHERPRREQAQSAKRHAESEGVKVALSDPCYEVWTLLHVEDTGESFDNCGKVLDCVKQAWEKRFRQTLGPKAQADISKIIALRLEAAARAKQHRENDDPSWTEVYRIIEDIESIVQGAGAEAK